MFRKIFTEKEAATDRECPVAGYGPGAAAGMAARLLIAPTSLMQMTLADAHVVVRYRHPQRIARGTVFIREGDGRDTGFMLLLLDGEVTVETRVASRDAPIVITLLGPGSRRRRPARGGRTPTGVGEWGWSTGPTAGKGR